MYGLWSRVTASLTQQLYVTGISLSFFFSFHPLRLILVCACISLRTERIRGMSRRDLYIRRQEKATQAIL